VCVCVVCVEKLHCPFHSVCVWEYFNTVCVGQWDPVWVSGKIKGGAGLIQIFPPSHLSRRLNEAHLSIPRIHSYENTGQVYGLSGIKIVKG